MRHLLHHTGGLRDYIELMSLQGVLEEDLSPESDVLDDHGPAEGAQFRARARSYLYCNTGYYLLALVVERASGQSLRDFAEQRIFAPLGMRHTQFNDSHTRIIPNRATGYRREGSRLRHRDVRLGADRRRRRADDGRGSLSLGPELLRAEGGRRGAASRTMQMVGRPEQRQEDRLRLRSASGPTAGCRPSRTADPGPATARSCCAFREQKFAVACLCNDGAAPTRAGSRARSRRCISAG